MTSIAELISQSSLGTPAARQLTRRTPGWVLANVLARAKAQRPAPGENTGGPPPAAASELAPEDAARLFEASLGGDHGAFEELVRKATPVLGQVIAVYGLDRTSAEDVLLTTWLALVKRSDQVSAPIVLWWLATNARREARRVAGRGEALGQAGMRPPESIAANPVEGAASGAVYVDVLREERHRELREAFLGLRPRERELLTLLLHDPLLSYAKVSKQLGIPMGAVGPSLHRALERLRYVLTEEELADSEGLDADVRMD
jgi:RNA polymerase sigma factor (sigma-70 family)